MIPPDFQCTWWFEGWWQSCCVRHDVGALSDAGLWQCVVETAPDGLAWLGILVGAVMFVGIKLLRPFWRAAMSRRKS